MLVLAADKMWNRIKSSGGKESETVFSVAVCEHWTVNTRPQRQRPLDVGKFMHCECSSSLCAVHSARHSFSYSFAHAPQFLQFICAFCMCDGTNGGEKAGQNPSCVHFCSIKIAHMRANVWRWCVYSQFNCIVCRARRQHYIFIICYFHPFTIYCHLCAVSEFPYAFVFWILFASGSLWHRNRTNANAPHSMENNTNSAELIQAIAVSRMEMTSLLWRFHRNPRSILAITSQI